MHRITIQQGDELSTVDCDENTPILEAALEAGIDFPHDCKMGVCLSCACKLIDGTVDQSAGSLDDYVTSKGYALACSALPKSDVTLRVAAEGEMEELQITKFS